MIYAFMQEMESIRLVPTNKHNNRYSSFEIPGMSSCKYVFIKNETRTGLQSVFKGPYEVIGQNQDNVVVKMPTADGFREDVVNKARVKPAYIQKFEDIEV
jgi:hypothetical protein